MVRPTGSSGIGDGSTITGTPYRRSRLQGTPGVGTLASGSQVTMGTSSNSSSDQDRPVWEQHLRTKALKWLQDTLKEAQEFGTPNKEVRAIKMPDRLGMLLVASTQDSKPSTFEEASQHLIWRDAMMDEYHSIMKNDVWEIVPRPEGKSVVTSHWLYKLKHAADGSVEKYKAKFVARGFSQVEGIDYDETFASVARYTSIRALISIAVEIGWKIHQMDV